MSLLSGPTALSHIKFTPEYILHRILYVWWEKCNIICQDHISKIKRTILLHALPMSFYLIWFTMKWPIKNNCITLLISRRLAQGNISLAVNYAVWYSQMFSAMYSETIKLLLCSGCISYLHNRKSTVCFAAAAAATCRTTACLEKCWCYLYL